MLLRAIVNLDPYTFADDFAENIPAENENEQRSAEDWEAKTSRRYRIATAGDTLSFRNLAYFAAAALQR